MTDFVDPTVIAQIEAAKDELILEVAKISDNSDIIESYAGSLPNPIIPEAPIDGNTYGRKDAAWVDISAGVGGTWGTITGTLSNQTDLQAALDAKADTSSLATVATTGNYNDLNGLPTIIPDAPADGNQYARKDNAWEQVALPSLEDMVVTGTFTHAETGVIQASVTWNEPSIGGGANSKYGFTRVDTSGFGDTYEFYCLEDGVWHKQDTNPARRLAFIDEVSTSGTDISISNTSTQITVQSSTGSDGTIFGATGTFAGAMVAADKTKLDSIEAGAQVNTLNDVIAGTNITIDKTNPLNPVISSTASGGASTFTDLTDTPADYTGHAGKVVAVNGTEDALEFITPTGGGGGASLFTINSSRGFVMDENGVHVATLSNAQVNALDNYPAIITLMDTYKAHTFVLGQNYNGTKGDVAPSAWSGSINTQVVFRRTKNISGDWEFTLEAFNHDATDGAANGWYAVANNVTGTGNVTWTVLY